MRHINLNEYEDCIEKIKELTEQKAELLEACKSALWHEENGELESQNKGKPRLTEVIETLKQAIAHAEGRE